MAFAVNITQEVLDYLNACERLTPADRVRITDGISEELGRSADEFLTKNPHPFLPDRYWYDFGLMTEALEYRYFVFACNAEGHIFGVTEVQYVEEREEE